MLQITYTMGFGVKRLNYLTRQAVVYIVHVRKENDQAKQTTDDTG